MFHQELCLNHGTNNKADEEDKTLYLDHRMLKNLGLDQVEIYGSIKLTTGVPCAHKCIFIGNRCNVSIKPNW
jgi:hypothetical protein